MKREVRVQDIAGTLFVSVPKDIVDSLGIVKGMVMLADVERIGGTNVFYYIRKDINNIENKISNIENK